jgi:catechol 2,3-dioxygenase-like lactoylglutathione lyase family enzyme
MIDHTGFVVSDLAKARRFYDAVAEALDLATADNGEHAFLFGKSAADPLSLDRNAPAILLGGRVAAGTQPDPCRLHCEEQGDGR